MNFLGIDIGTSRCKAAIFDENGMQLAQAYRLYDVLFTPDGGAELDSDKVISKCFEVIRECTSRVKSQSVAGLGISCQGEAFTAVDGNGKTLSNAMVSMDMRAENYSKTWPGQLGTDRLYQITGQTAHPMYTLFKLLWLKDHMPELWNSAGKFLCFEDLLQYRLGLDPAIGWSLAGRTMLFDVREHRWSNDILDAIELSPEKLATPLPSGSFAGKVNSNVAADLGLAKDAFVVTAGHDQPCAALGAGVVSPGSAIYASGTVECITPVFSEPVFSEQLRNNNLCTYDHMVKDLYVSVAYSLTGGNILKWFRNEFSSREMEEAGRTGADPYELIVSQMDLNPSGLMVLPYFTPSGTPYFDTGTKGAILGLRLTTKRGEFIRALLEGVALEMRLNLEILESSGFQIDVLRIVGGGAKSNVLSQLKADVTGKKVIIPDVKESGCLGAAMLACSEHSKKPVSELSREWVKIIDEIEPDADFSSIYTDKFGKYKELYHKIKEIHL